MKRIITLAVAVLALAACTDTPVEPAPLSAPEAPSLMLEPVPQGSLVDPNTQKIRALLAPVQSHVPGATGRVVFNDVQGAGKVIIQTNVWGMHPHTAYELHLAVNNVRVVYNVGVFVTDENGDASLHSSVPFGVIGEFDIVNIRIPNMGGTRRLSSWPADGGSLSAN